MSLNGTSLNDLKEKTSLVVDEAYDDESTQGYFSASGSESAQGLHSATDSNSDQESTTTKNATTDSKSSKPHIDSEDQVVKKKPPLIIIKNKKDWYAEEVRNGMKNDIKFVSYKNKYDGGRGVRLRVSTPEEHRYLSSHLIQKDIEFSTYSPDEKYKLPRYMKDLLKHKYKATRAYKRYPTFKNKIRYLDLKMDVQRVVTEYKYRLYDRSVRRKKGTRTTVYNFLSAPEGPLEGFACDKYELEDYLREYYVGFFLKERKVVIYEYSNLLIRMLEFLGYSIADELRGELPPLFKRKSSSVRSGYVTIFSKRRFGRGRISRRSKPAKKCQDGLRSFIDDVHSVTTYFTECMEICSKLFKQ